MISSDDVFGLSGKTVVLAGANGLLGRRCVQSYLEAGVNVAALDLRIDLQAPPRAKAKLWSRELDLLDEAAVDKAVADAINDLGSIDGVHHACTGKPDGFFDAFEDYSLDTWRKVQHYNVDTALPLLQAIIPHLKAQRRGSVLLTSSIYGVVGADQRIYEGSEYLGRAINTPVAYAAAKATIIGIMRHLAAELGAFGIRVNAITPGGVASGQNEVFTKKYSGRVPLGRMGKPEEIAAPALFLLSDGAAYINGQNLIVDGGLTAW